MKLYRIFTAAIVIVLLVGSVSLPAAAGQGNATGKIEPLVLEEITTNGQTDYFIWMAEKADLSPADQLHTKLEKGQFVYNTLRETAERSQRDLRRYLDGQGIQYEAFYIANKVLVRGGGQVLLNTLVARPDVAQITANHQFQLQEPFKDANVSNTPLGIETNVTFIKAPQAWALGYSGQGTVIAGNDTGLDEAHPAIARHYRGCLNPPTCSSWDHNYNWWDATGTYPTNPFDGHGHGTHTTGTMVGDDGGSNQIGVAPGAQTVHCKNMTNSGSGSDATFTTCFQWDLAPWNLSGTNPDPAKAPDAINNSWGYGGGGQNQFRDEIQALHAAGILVEVSAGNEGSSCSSLRSPGDYWEVLTTGSVNHASALPGSMTSFSSRGPSDLDGNYFPDITAPGEGIRSSLPNNTYASWSGTSMAGPHATALIGLMWSACPSLQGQVYATIDIIHQTAVPVNYTGACGGNYVTGPNNDWGYGTIDALAAVQAAVAQCGGGGSGTLQGTVTDSATGLPIAGAAISAVGTGGTYNATTDANGFYQITLPAGSYDVSATKTGYTSQTATGVAVTAGATTVQDFALDPVQTNTLHVNAITLSYTIKGKRITVQSTVSILDQNGSPVSSAAVSGEWTLPNNTITAQSATTNTSGVATFRLISKLRGVYEICVTNVVKAGYVYDPAQNVETCDTIIVP
jgi:subtilisin family serine protease